MRRVLARLLARTVEGWSLRASTRVAEHAQHASLWDDTDWTWLQDHDPEANWRSPVPDPTAETAIARVDRERRGR